jgi:organic hydroperoxide reductase OsmC/OhrA
MAERRGVSVHALDVRADGRLERGQEHGYRFAELRLDVQLETAPGLESAAEEVAVLAKEHCIVARALDVPVHVRLTVRPVLSAVLRAA